MNIGTSLFSMQLDFDELVYAVDSILDKKAVLPQGNRAMPKLFFSV